MRALVDQDSRKAVSAADQQIGHAVAVPVAEARPRLIAERQNGRLRLGLSASLESRGFAGGADKLEDRRCV